MSLCKHVDQTRLERLTDLLQHDYIIHYIKYNLTCKLIVSVTFTTDCHNSNLLLLDQPFFWIFSRLGLVHQKPSKVEHLDVLVQNFFCAVTHPTVSSH